MLFDSRRDSNPTRRDDSPVSAQSPRVVDAGRSTRPNPLLRPSSQPVLLSEASSSRSERSSSSNESVVRVLLLLLVLRSELPLLLLNDGLGNGRSSRSDLGCWRSDGDDRGIRGRGDFLDGKRGGRRRGRRGGLLGSWDSYGWRGSEGSSESRRREVGRRLEGRRDDNEGVLVVVVGHGKVVRRLVLATRTRTDPTRQSQRFHLEREVRAREESEDGLTASGKGKEPAAAAEEEAT